MENLDSNEGSDHEGNEIADIDDALDLDFDPEVKEDEEEKKEEEVKELTEELKGKDDELEDVNDEIAKLEAEILAAESNRELSQHLEGGKDVNLEEVKGEIA